MSSGAALLTLLLATLGCWHGVSADANSIEELFEQLCPREAEPPPEDIELPPRELTWERRPLVRAVVLTAAGVGLCAMGYVLALIPQPPLVAARVQRAWRRLLGPPALPLLQVELPSGTPRSNERNGEDEDGGHDGSGSLPPSPFASPFAPPSALRSDVPKGEADVKRDVGREVVELEPKKTKKREETVMFMRAVCDRPSEYLIEKEKSLETEMTLVRAERNADAAPLCNVAIGLLALPRHIPLPDSRPPSIHQDLSPLDLASASPTSDNKGSEAEGGEGAPGERRPRAARIRRHPSKSTEATHDSSPRDRRHHRHHHHCHRHHHRHHHHCHRHHHRHHQCRLHGRSPSAFSSDSTPSSPSHSLSLPTADCDQTLHGPHDRQTEASARESRRRSCSRRRSHSPLSLETRRPLGRNRSKLRRAQPLSRPTSRSERRRARERHLRSRSRSPHPASNAARGSASREEARGHSDDVLAHGAAQASSEQPKNANLMQMTIPGFITLPVASFSPMALFFRAVMNTNSSPTDSSISAVTPALPQMDESTTERSSEKDWPSETQVCCDDYPSFSSEGATMADEPDLRDVADDSDVAIWGAGQFINGVYDQVDDLRPESSTRQTLSAAPNPSILTSETGWDSPSTTVNTPSQMTSRTPSPPPATASWLRQPSATPSMDGPTSQGSPEWKSTPPYPSTRATTPGHLDSAETPQSSLHRDWTPPPTSLSTPALSRPPSPLPPLSSEPSSSTRPPSSSTRPPSSSTWTPSSSTRPLSSSTRPLSSSTRPLSSSTRPLSSSTRPPSSLLPPTLPHSQCPFKSSSSPPASLRSLALTVIVPVTSATADSSATPLTLPTRTTPTTLTPPTPPTTPTTTTTSATSTTPTTLMKPSRPLISARETSCESKALATAASHIPVLSGTYRMLDASTSGQEAFLLRGRRGGELLAIMEEEATTSHASVCLSTATNSMTTVSSGSLRDVQESLSEMDVMVDVSYSGVSGVCGCSSKGWSAETTPSDSETDGALRSLREWRLRGRQRQGLQNSAAQAAGAPIPLPPPPRSIAPEVHRLDSECSPGLGAEQGSSRSAPDTAPQRSFSWAASQERGFLTQSPAFRRFLGIIEPATVAQGRPSEAEKRRGRRALR